MSDELGAYVIIPDGASLEVQEDQLPFPLLGESRGEKASDVMPGLLPIVTFRSLPITPGRTGRPAI